MVGRPAQLAACAAASATPVSAMTPPGSSKNRTHNDF
jgi:hypothetical protein